MNSFGNSSFLGLLLKYVFMRKRKTMMIVVMSIDREQIKRSKIKRGVQVRLIGGTFSVERIWKAGILKKSLKY
jgi:hypothetical protein